MPENQLRWKVTLVYRSKVGLVDVEHFVEELDDIADLIEAGPDWNSLIEGRFALARRTETETYTVEEADAS